MRRPHCPRVRRARLLASGRDSGGCGEGGRGEEGAMGEDGGGDDTGAVDGRPGHHQREPLRYVSLSLQYRGASFYLG